MGNRSEELARELYERVTGQKWKDCHTDNYWRNIADDFLDEGWRKGSAEEDDALTWIIEFVADFNPWASDHFYHICEGRDYSCGCPLQEAVSEGCVQ